jgi:kumamolisin
MNIGKGMLGIMVKGLLLSGLTVSAAASATGLMQVKDNTPPAVAKAKLVRHHNPNAVLDIRLVLPLRNGDQLNQYLHDVRDRSSPNYHKFLTPAQVTALYGPTAAQVQTVTEFLTAHGIKVTEISPYNTRIHATAKTSVLESAFGVAINDYNAGGKAFYSASGNPSLPANIAPLVSAVLGMDDAVTFTSHSVAGPTPKGAGVGPSGFLPNQIATAYDWPDITNTANASGVTIAIATAFSYRPADLAKFWATAGVPTHTVTKIAVDNRPTNVLNGETTLDIERSSSMSPGSSILVYECVNPAFVCFDDEFAEIATDNLADVVSTSWGAAESSNSLSSIGAEHQSFTILAVQGQTVFAAAGDNGSADGAAGTDNADFPSSDPLVVAAGGTSLSLDGGNNIANETAWSGAGGADSVIFAVPSYQTGFINGACLGDLTGDSADFGTTTGDLCGGSGNDSRQSSDMSMDANPGTGYALYFDGRWEVFGGTSFVAPELAGLFANLVKQAGGRVSTGGQLLYCAGFGPNAGVDFHDITVGSNGKFNAVVGWDHPTGFGTPDATILLSDIVANCL